MRPTGPAHAALRTPGRPEVGPAPRAVADLTTGRAVRIGRILLATDFGPESADAESRALELAQRLGASLVVLTVVDPRGLRRPGQPTLRVDQARALRERQVTALVEQARDLGITASFLVWDGDPGSTVVAAIEAEGADLAIVGRRGRGRLERAVLGSVSDHVVRHAACPVLVVRSEWGEAESESDGRVAPA